MSKKNPIKQATESVIGLGRLAFLALAGTILLVALLLLGNIILYTLARVTEALFDLVKFIFEG